MLAKVKDFFFRYERYVSPVTLCSGFIVDNIMLKRIDVFFSNAVIISYLIVAALCILTLNIAQTKAGDQGRETTFHVILVFIMQFSFGGLFSASFLFYSRSGSIFAGWPFLLLILGYLLGNEFLRKNYTRLGFQVSAFFAALFSYLIFFLPVILGRMDDAIFLLSGISSMIITGFFVYMLSWFTPARVRKGAGIVIAAVLGIFVVVNTLYFANLIPPIPLALKELSIQRSLQHYPDGSYLLTGERQSWFATFFGRSEVSYVPGQPLYAFSAVFAPSRLATEVEHVWQYRDSSTGEWATASRIPLLITGGRDGGFRTYSVKESLFPGRWRVNVETPRGQLIGRYSFDLVRSTGDEELVTRVQ